MNTIKIRNNKKTKSLVKPVVAGKYDANKLLEIIKSVYRQGYYDSKIISEHRMNEIADTFSATKILNKCRV